MISLEVCLLEIYVSTIGSRYYPRCSREIKILRWTKIQGIFKRYFHIFLYRCLRVQRQTQRGVTRGKWDIYLGAYVAEISSQWSGEKNVSRWTPCSSSTCPTTIPDSLRVSLLVRLGSFLWGHLPTSDKAVCDVSKKCQKCITGVVEGWEWNHQTHICCWFKHFLQNGNVSFPAGLIYTFLHEELYKYWQWIAPSILLSWE